MMGDELGVGESEENLSEDDPLEDEPEQPEETPERRSLARRIGGTVRSTWNKPLVKAGVFFAAGAATVAALFGGPYLPDHLMYEEEEVVNVLYQCGAWHSEALPLVVGMEEELRMVRDTYMVRYNREGYFAWQQALPQYFSDFSRQSEKLTLQRPPERLVEMGLYYGHIIELVDEGADGYVDYLTVYVRMWNPSEGISGTEWVRRDFSREDLDEESGEYLDVLLAEYKLDFDIDSNCD